MVVCGKKEQGPLKISHGLLTPGFMTDPNILGKVLVFMALPEAKFTFRSTSLRLTQDFLLA